MQVPTFDTNTPKSGSKTCAFQFLSQAWATVYTHLWLGLMPTAQPPLIPPW